MSTTPYERTPESAARLERLRQDPAIAEILDFYDQDHSHITLEWRSNPNYDPELSRATLESPSAGRLEPDDVWKRYGHLVHRDPPR